MTKPTGNPPGRPPGRKNAGTLAVEAAAKAAAAAVNEVIPGAFNGDAHAFLVAVYKDPAQPIELRLDAAKAAVRYEKPALASMDMTGRNEHVVHMVSSEPLTIEEWEAQYCAPTEH